MVAYQLDFVVLWSTDTGVICGPLHFNQDDFTFVQP